MNTGFLLVWKSALVREGYGWTRWSRESLPTEVIRWNSKLSQHLKALRPFFSAFFISCPLLIFSLFCENDSKHFCNQGMKRSDDVRYQFSLQRLNWIHRDVKGKDSRPSFLRKDGPSDQRGLLGYRFVFGTCMNRTSLSQSTNSG